MTIESTELSAAPEQLTGERMIISAHTGGVLIPDSFVNKRQHLKALREDHERLQGHHRFELTPTGSDTYSIRHVATDRFLEPLRKQEDTAVYENIRYQGPILLEKQLPQARDQWQLRRRGDYYQIALTGTRYVLGLTHPDHMDSWITLLDPWWSKDRLWLIQEVPQG